MFARGQKQARTATAPLSDTGVFSGVHATFMLCDVVSPGYLCDVVTFRFEKSRSAPLCALCRLSAPARQVAVFTCRLLAAAAVEEEEEDAAVRQSAIC